jgi:hypothetical protein
VEPDPWVGADHEVGGPVTLFIGCRSDFRFYHGPAVIYHFLAGKRIEAVARRRLRTA